MGSDGSFSLIDEIIYTRFGNFLLFTLGFILLAVVLFTAVRKRNAGLPFTSFLLKVVPFLIPLLWLYGTLFHPPNNFSAVKRYGFMSYWFNSYQLADIKEHIVVFWCWAGSAFY